MERPRGARDRYLGRWDDDRGGPWEGNGGWPEQDRAKSRMVARGSVRPFGGSVVRVPTPRTRQAAQVRGSAVTRCLAPQPPPATRAHSTQTTPGSREASAKPPRGTEITRTALPKAENQLCFRCSVQPIVPTPGGRRASRGRASGAQSNPAALPAPLGAGGGGDLGPPRRVRALGEPLWDSSAGPC